MRDIQAEVPGALGVAEERGTLYAYGNEGGVLAIWFSRDGVGWTKAEVEPMAPAGASGTFVALVDAGDRLVALAIRGNPGGSGPTATPVYVSADGSAWTQVDADLPPLSDALVVGDRIVAAGDGVWESEDAGLTWSALTAREQMDGYVSDLALGDDLLVGVGLMGLEIPAPPALAWTSQDLGLTWERTELDAEAVAVGVALGSSGHAVAIGHEAPSSNENRVWISQDQGRTWGGTTLGGWCCLIDVAATPSGFVIAAPPDDLGKLYLSPDGFQWQSQLIPFDAVDIVWTPTFGLVAATGEGVAIGPETAP